jgi:hypothetical protein
MGVAPAPAAMQTCSPRAHPIYALFAALLLGPACAVESVTTASKEHEFATQVAPRPALAILVPLYSYPSHWDRATYLWDDVAAAAARVPIAAIINPQNGPTPGQANGDYVFGLGQLRDAGVTLLGYVYTGYGARSLDEVKADIDAYDQHYLVQGIFFDEAASSAERIDYYAQVHSYVRHRQDPWALILNQGTQTDEDYVAVADTVVVFEDTWDQWATYQAGPYLPRYPSHRFATLIHKTPAERMKQAVDLAVQRNITHLFVTDDSLDSADQNPWNSLPTYWTDLVGYVEQLNAVAEALSASEPLAADEDEISP